MIDIVMSGVPVTTANIGDFTFSDPYLRLYLAALVPENSPLELAFENVETLARTPDVTLGYIEPAPFINNIRTMFPDMALKEYPDTDAFFENAGPREALYTSAEAGSALSLLHPEDRVIVPSKHDIFNIAYPVDPLDQEFLQFLNQWIDIQTDSRDFQHIYDFWILGHPRDDQKPRWSIARDVLGWFDN